MRLWSAALSWEQRRKEEHNWNTQTAGLKEIDVQEKGTENDVPLIVVIGKDSIRLSD